MHEYRCLQAQYLNFKKDREKQGKNGTENMRYGQKKIGHDFFGREGEQIGESRK